MNIIGHQKIINLLDKAIAKKAVSQAYLFAGPEAVGKFTVALNFAQKLAGEDGQKNGNILVIAPEMEEKKGVVKKHDIKIEQIRDLQHQLSLSAQAGKHKVAIIDGAERLNKTAQNALLKTLEDANENVVLILICQNEKKMLSTILSRCHKIKFGTVANRELEKYLTDAKNREDIIFWSLGRPGLLLELQSDAEALEFRQGVASELQNLCTQNLTEKFALAEEMSKDVNVSLQKMDLWTVILREIVLDQKKGLTISAPKALKILDGINRSSEVLKTTNANSRLVLENLFLEF